MIVEPVVGNMGCVPPDPFYLDALREITQRDKCVLIFDEVMTGFRLAFGGAQERYGILPDLTTFGKIIGGGLPVGAYGGPSEIMDMVAPLGPVYQAGTLSGNPLAMAAGLATLRYLRSHKEHALYRAWRLTQRTVGRRSDSRRQRGGCVHSAAIAWVHVYLVLYGWPGDRLDVGREVRHQSFRPFLPRHAGRWACICRHPSSK